MDAPLRPSEVCIIVEPLYCGHLGDLVKCPVYMVEPLYCGHLGDLVKCPVYIVEPLYCGHLGDLVKCPVYSGTPLLWTPWGPGEVSCIQWNPSIMDTLGTW